MTKAALDGTEICQRLIDYAADWRSRSASNLVVLDALNFIRQQQAEIDQLRAERSREAFQIGDRVKIVAETAGHEWAGEAPHFIVGVDWHPLYGITYTTSECWPPRVRGRHIESLTDGWAKHNLLAASSQEPGRG